MVYWRFIFIALTQSLYSFDSITLVANSFNIESDYKSSNSIFVYKTVSKVNKEDRGSYELQFALYS